MKTLVVPESDHIVVPVNFVCVPYYLAEIHVPDYILYLVSCFIKEYEIPMVLVKNFYIVGYVFYDHEKSMKISVETRKIKIRLRYYEGMIHNYKIGSKNLIMSTIKNETTNITYLGQSLPKMNDILYCDMNLYQFMEKYKTIFVMQPTHIFNYLDFKPDHKIIFEDQVDLNLTVDIALITGCFHETITSLIERKRICCL